MPSLKPFLSLLVTCFKYLILPVPSVFLLLALTDQLSKGSRSEAGGSLTSSLLLTGVAGGSASLLLSVPRLGASYSAQGVGLVVATSH